MYWPDEIRAFDADVNLDVKVRDQELEMARQLIENLTAEWNPAEFKDGYREALLQIVEAKINGQEIEVVAPEPTAKVVDLMEALKASVSAAKKQAADQEPAPAKKAAAKKSSASTKKSAAKKPASAKKPAAKKTTSTRKKAVGE
jgi:DNA end-binding protein Ku